MKQIKLSNGHVALVDDEDFDAVSKYRWYGRPHRHTVYAFMTCRKKLQMHRFILSAKRGQIIDHRDGDGLNNKRNNINISSHSKNQRNRHHTTTSSGIVGAYVSSENASTWYSKVKVNGKRVYLGTFPSAERAGEARLEYIRKNNLL